MKIPAQAVVLLTICSLASLPLRAQDDMGVPAPPPPSPENGPYVAPNDQGTPPPENQGGPDQSNPDESASFQTFYDGLAPQGTWMQSSDFGYVWQPAVNDPNWAPYTNGHWVYTNVGWTWVSDEPWGWATYHYGRWVNLDGTGWCWVPGYTWAPAWVSWRYGAGYCGWAPLPPASFVGIDYGGDDVQVSAVFHIGGDCDSYYGIGAGWYHFVPVNYLGAPNYRGHYANRHDNYAIINGTTNVTNLNVIRNGAGSGPGGFAQVTNGGPSLAQVNAVAAAPVQQVRLTGASQPGATLLANNSLALFAPRVTPASGRGFQPSRVGGSLGQATINRGVDITRPFAATRNLPAPAPTPAQIQQAQFAQANVPSGARVVTASTPVNPVLQRPLTNFQPIEVGNTYQPPGNTVFNVQHSSQAPAPASRQGVVYTWNGAANYPPKVYTPGAPISQGIPIVERTTANGSIVRSYVPTNYQNPSSNGSYNPYSSQSPQAFPNGTSNGSRQYPYPSQSSPGGNSNGGNPARGNHGGNGQNWNNQQQQNH
jgi:hypothetical protein